MAGRTPQITDLDIIRGDTCSFIFQPKLCDSLNPSTYPDGILTEPTVINGVTWMPFDLTGYEVRSQIRKTRLYAEPLAMPFTVTVMDAALGIFKLSLTKEQTTNLAMNDSVSYTYDVQIDAIDGTESTTYLSGAINITLDVTR